MPAKELPDTKSKPMDPVVLGNLIFDAMIRVNAFTKSRKFPTESIGVFAPETDDTWSTQNLIRPNLGDALLNPYSERTSLPEVVKLLDYLWEHGGTKVALSMDSGVPGRNAWNGHACHQLISVPLYHLWNEASVRSFSRKKAWRPLDVSKRSVRKMADLTAKAECGNGRMIQVVTPLLQTHLVDFQAYEIMHGVFLKKWTKDDRSWYWHRHGSWYPRDDILAIHHDGTVIEMMVNEKSLTGDSNDRDSVAQAVGAQLASIKWAIGQIDPSQPQREHPTTIDTFSDGRSFFPIRRQNIQHTMEGGITLHRKDCLTIARKLKELNAAKEKFADLEDVLWMFDRATNAGSSRDALLEATIGLERLLVGASGENTRRFRMFGTALLPGHDASQVEDDLKQIYKMRSGVAHGDTGKIADLKKFSLYATKAKAYFSEIIYNVSVLVNAEALQKKHKIGLNETIEKYLTELMYSASKAAFQKTNRKKTKSKCT